MDAIGKVTLLAETEISSLLKPADVVWLWVWFCRQPQLFNGLSWDEVIMDIVINKYMQWCPLHPHLWVEEALFLFRIYWFFSLNCCVRDSGSGVYVDDVSIFNILLIRFSIRVRLHGFDLDDQWLFRVTFIGVVPVDFVEVTLFPMSFFIFPLPFFSYVLYYFSGGYLLGSSLSFFGCWRFWDLSSHLFWWLKFFSILTTYR